MAFTPSIRAAPKQRSRIYTPHASRLVAQSRIRSAGSDMRNHRLRGIEQDRDVFVSPFASTARPRHWRPGASKPNSPEEVLGEVGVVVVIVLAIVLAINVGLIALHIA
jgi:hypothetical protein